jgi:cytochrome bd ubiquinol oxidase subunit I
MFFAVVILYALVGAITILVLRGMSRRFRRSGGFTDLDTPYGPSSITKAAAQTEETVG